MATIHGFGNGNKESGQNTITPPMFAEMFRFLMGRDVAVLQRGEFSNSSSDENYSKPKLPNYNWDTSIKIGDNVLTKDIDIASGLALIYGYVVYSDTPYSFSVQPPSSGVRYAWVYVKVDLSDSSVANFSLDLLTNDNDSGYWASNEQDNLITNPNGKYSLPLYRFRIQPSGAIDQVTSIEGLASEFGVNVGVQSMVEISKLSRLADEAKWIRNTQGSSNNSVGFTIGTKNFVVEY